MQNYHTISLILHAIKITLQKRPKNTRHFLWIIEKARNNKNSMCFVDYRKDFDCVNYEQCTQKMRNSEHFFILMQNLYCRQEVTWWTNREDGIQAGKGARQDCILSPQLLFIQITCSIYIEGTELEEDRCHLKAVRRNINNMLC